MTPERFQGGRGMVVSGVAGLAGLALTAVGAAVNLRSTLFSYLMAFAFWLGLGLGGLLLLAIFHASNAKWIVVVRRVMEGLAAALPVFVLLFIPIALGMKELFVWVSPPTALGKHALELIAHKRPYLNVPFFLVRAAVYFGIWLVVAHLLRSWSLRQDDTGDPALTRRQRSLGAGALPFLALSLTFASFDWLMSLDPTWFSTIYGVNYFAGAFLGALALVTLIACLSPPTSALGAAVSPEHRHNLGKFVFAFVAFWGYIAFSQYMLIWIANLPEEVSYFLPRSRGSWGWVSVALVCAQFVVPFFALLSRELKRGRRGLAFICGWILCAHALDTYWLVMPTLDGASAAPHWTVLPAWVGVGGVSVAFALWRLRGTFVLPVKDPFLAESLRYMQP